jgi:hypothetical protein
MRTGIRWFNNPTSKLHAKRNVPGNKPHTIISIDDTSLLHASEQATAT